MALIGIAPSRSHHPSFNHARRRARHVAVRVVGAALLSGCALPPPGALFEWSHVQPFEMPASRPLAPVAADWQAFVQGTTAIADACDADACGRDPQAWVGRCVQPRAEAFARKTVAGLKSTGDWRAQGWSRLSPPAAISAATSNVGAAACDPRWQSTTAAAAVLQAMAAEAGGGLQATCPGPRRIELAVEVAEIDHARQSPGDFIAHDMSALFGSILLGSLTLGTVTTMNDMVHRVVTLQLTLPTDDASPLRLKVRGAAGIRLGSLKMADPMTPAPPELVTVAFVQALRRLDAEMRSLPCPVCPPKVD